MVNSMEDDLKVKVSVETRWRLSGQQTVGEEDTDGREGLAKAKHKNYGDKLWMAKYTLVEVGYRLLIKQNKTTTKQPWDPSLYNKTKVRGTQVTEQRVSKERIRYIEK